MAEDNDDKSNSRIVQGLAAVITTAWAVSFIVDILDKSYEPPASVHALMLLVAGAVFGEGLLRSNKPKESKDNA